MIMSGNLEWAEYNSAISELNCVLNMLTMKYLSLDSLKSDFGVQSQSKSSFHSHFFEFCFQAWTPVV